MACEMALKAVGTVSQDMGAGRQEIDIKRYAKVEKIPGGTIEESEVLNGVMLNKDVTHPRMRRYCDTLCCVVMKNCNIFVAKLIIGFVLLLLCYLLHFPCV